MITMTIDGKQIQTDASKTIIDAAFENDIYIPHFCWHPALSISGNCRLCLVEVEKMPKEVIACSTLCTEGMVVHVNSEKAIKTRNAVMEFLLINHPLDCPICDEAGECKLQDYTYRYSVGESRFDEEKVQKRKRVALGPRVMFDGERCIQCSRCIRFCDDVVGEHELTFVNRGDRVTIETFPGKELDNPYSLNVVDICPVGALTSKDFRFKARVWEMSHTDSVCPGCARGCSIEIWARQNEILRLTPRANPAVNDYWMCDNGRLNSFQHVGAPTRISKPLVRRVDTLNAVAWDEAIAHVASDLRAFKKEQIAVLGSAFATCEDNYALQKFAREVLGTEYIDFIRHLVPEDQDSLLICADKTPNSAGADIVGVKPKDADHNLDAIIRLIESRKIQALIVMDDDVASIPELARVIDKLSYILVIASNTSPMTARADAVLPSATFAEKEGTFINFQHHLQIIRPAVTTVENEGKMNAFGRSRLDAFGSEFDRWGKTEKRDCKSGWMIFTQLAAVQNVKWKFEWAEDVFEEMARNIPLLKGLSYESIGNRGTRLVGAVEEPEFLYEDVHYL